jgi:hypothetical protein
LPTTRKKVLFQTWLDPRIGCKFDRLAKTRGHKRASYLRYVIETVCSKERCLEATETALRRLRP